jgi:hypothetical protein
MLEKTFQGSVKAFILIVECEHYARRGGLDAQYVREYRLWRDSNEVSEAQYND